MKGYAERLNVIYVAVDKVKMKILWNLLIKCTVHISVCISMSMFATYQNFHHAVDRERYSDNRGGWEEVGGIIDRKYDVV